jgi:hypothetical protein
LEDGELGTNKNLVPNSPLPKPQSALGTNKNLVPNANEDGELGTKEKLVPNSPLPKPPSALGTKKNLVPNADGDSELGTKKNLVPNAEIWKPPIGCLNQKWVKSDRYWYWSYYKSKGKKGSLYLAKDYNEAIAKAKKIGMPPNAKPPNLRATAPEY